jgi:hypothetical protein
MCTSMNFSDIFQVQLSIVFCLQIWKPVVCNIQQLRMNNFLPKLKKMLLLIDTLLNYSCFGRKLFMRSCWMLQTTGFHICKQKTIDNCTWNISLKFIEVHIFCYLMPVIGKNMISWFYAYVEHSEIKTKTVNIIHFPYLDLS